jgi:hypothetical protein
MTEQLMLQKSSASRNTGRFMQCLHSASFNRQSWSDRLGRPGKILGMSIA